MRPNLRNLPFLLRRTLLASIDDGLFGIAKGAAYSSLLSLFPVLTSVAVIFVQTGAKYVQENVTRFLSRVLPPGTETDVLQQFRVQGQKPAALLVVAFLLSLWAASSVVKSLIDGFNAAYRVPRNRSVGGHIGMGLMLVIFAGIPLLGASSLILFGGAVQTGVLKLMRVDPLLHPLEGWWRLITQVMRYLVAFG
ncbi:MAG TPA: YhjD/YihY/BrkB family envelope integrity protein, partial [Bryobacteraceae bacterium]|nr:YhjD/YihY/BrkB family envelope integrity protein [Bryobacteraceae bacterium]